VIAFWVPDAPTRRGTSRILDYRLHWIAAEPTRLYLAGSLRAGWRVPESRACRQEKARMSSNAHTATAGDADRQWRIPRAGCLESHGYDSVPLHGDT
jgi:hypothetical protein